MKQTKPSKEEEMRWFESHSEGMCSRSADKEFERRVGVVHDS